MLQPNSREYMCDYCLHCQATLDWCLHCGSRIAQPCLLSIRLLLLTAKQLGLSCFVSKQVTVCAVCMGP
jgi:hypothetical protein